ncbi:MAG TPA: cytochrome c3 family protein [Candidatus Nitrosotenuis sp.]|jgi:hypothetical protein|nr:cytochrome c3 family protein [Candidatus Nitrosotenuis sp.]
MNVSYEEKVWFGARKAFVLLFLLAALAVPAVWAWDHYRYKAPEQPVNFPHDIHARDRQIDCTYCHEGAVRGEYAGVPSVTKCWRCHQTVNAFMDTQKRASTELDKLEQYVNNKASIPWRKVYSVPEHVKFSHQVHVARFGGSPEACYKCHGQVENMKTAQLPEGFLGIPVNAPIEGSVGSWVLPPLSMGWCIECHRVNGASINCSICHY